MARILAISSFLAHGRVGLGATVPVLQACGHEVLQLPTVILSNHPAHAHVAGHAVAPETLSAMLGAFEANGWLAGIGAVVTGYLPTRGHVAFACDAASRVRRHNPHAQIICDPILGDDPKGLYIDADAAAAIRDTLVPMAGVITPNRFELHWLTGMRIENQRDAALAARALQGPSVVATSIPAANSPSGDRRLANVVITRDAVETHADTEQAGIPHGTGDVFTALITASLMSQGATLPGAAATSHRTLQRIVSASAGKQHLDLSPLTSIAHLP